MKTKQTVVLVTCLLALAGSATTMAQAVAGLKSFEPVSDYIIEIGGAPISSAEVFYSELAGAYLVLDDGLEAPLLISPRERRVSTLQFLKVSRKSDGSVSVLPQAELSDQGEFYVEGSEARFSVDGQPGALKPKPPVLGDKSLSEMSESSAAYVFRSQKYKASDVIVSQLQKSDDVSVTVFFGSWCPACGQAVPRIMKVAEQLGDESIDFTFHGLPRQINEDPMAEQNGVTSVPTAIVYRSGREIGRLSGQDWKVPELALSKLLGASS